MHPSPVLPVI